MKEEEEEKRVKKNFFPYHERIRALDQQLSSGILTLAQKIKIDAEVRELLSYSRENWGAPFIAIFAILMIFSVIEFDLTDTILASQVAFYGSAFLILGVGLQALCYMYFRNYRSKKSTAD